MRMRPSVTLSAVLVLFALATPTGAASAQPGPAPLPRLFLTGACTHFGQGKGMLDRNLNSMKQGGIASIRDEVVWSELEREKGKLAMTPRLEGYVRRAAMEGFHVLLILDYSNRFYDDGDRPRSPEAIEGFCRYAEFVVKHFGKQVRLYEVWNEWDIGIGLRKPYDKGGSAEDYVKLLKAVYPRVKAAEPNAIVMAGGATSGGVRKGWLEEIVKLGALDACDAISIHSYNYSAPFPERGPEACSAWMTGVQEMLRKDHGGKDVPFYVTEMGWPTHVTKHGTDPELAASYLARLYLLARTSPSFQGLWWYDFQDDGWNPEYNEDNFGLVRPDLTPKPAYYALRAVAPLVTYGQYIDRLSTKDENLWVLRFKVGPDDMWALWSGDDQDRQVILQTTSVGPSLVLRQVGREPYVTRWGYREWVGKTNETQVIHDRLALIIGPRPWIIGNRLSDVSVVDVIPRPRPSPEKP